MDDDTRAEIDLLAAMFEGLLVNEDEAATRCALRLTLLPRGGYPALRRCTAELELELELGGYPDAMPPSVRLRHARGLVDKEEALIVSAAREVIAERAGERCCFDAISAALDAITEVTEAGGDCPVCLQPLGAEDGFRAPCDHCFHAACVARWRHASDTREQASAESAAPGASAEEQRARAAAADLEQARAREREASERVRALQLSLEHAQAQLAALPEAERAQATGLARQARTQKQALADARRECERVGARAAKLSARADVELSAAASAADLRARGAEQRPLPCPVCRLPIGANALGRLAGVAAAPNGAGARVEGGGVEGSADAPPTDPPTPGWLAELEPAELERVRAAQARHASIARAQAQAEAAAEGGGSGSAAPGADGEHEQPGAGQAPRAIPDGGNPASHAGARGAGGPPRGRPRSGARGGRRSNSTGDPPGRGTAGRGGEPPRRGGGRVARPGAAGRSVGGGPAAA